MKYRFDGYNWLVRLETGEKLIESLTSLAKAQKIGGAWLNGIGTATWAEIGFYDLNQQKYIWRKFNQHVEITGLQGNISWDGDKPTLHIHGSFADSDMQAYGGHVKELEVASTCEVLVHRWYESGLTRQLDETTGLKLLDL